MKRRLSIFALVGLFGCEAPTQLIVWVDSDYESPRELSSLLAFVRDPRGETVGAEAFDIRDFPLPLSFGVEAKSFADDQVSILIQGARPDGTLLVERTATVGFIKGERRLLPMFLARSCAGRTCDLGQTCTEQGCLADFVEVRSLPRLENPGDEQDFDAGIQITDTGTGGPTDGGVTDGMVVDTGVRDAGVPDVGRPDLGVPDADVPDGGPPDDCFVNGCAFDETCINGGGGVCMGGEPCFCVLACDPFLEFETCPAGSACFWNDVNDIFAGICIDENQSDADNFRSLCGAPDECDQFENWNCVGLVQQVVGECTTYCRDDLRCNALVPGTECAFQEWLPSGLGLCLEPVPNNTIGDACMLDADCDAGSFCNDNLGYCSSFCNGLTQCPLTGSCLSDGMNNFCLFICGSSMDCEGGNTVCRDDFPLPVCLYPCTVQPCGPGLTCQPDGTCL